MRELSETKPQFMSDGITNAAEHSALIKLRRAESTDRYQK
jgi:hypothetical protein